ncbi:helix-hairpin-helix domain-containing protein [Actinomyces sp. AC-19-1]|nr:helix-hairpin-helix domain-containing protein [Actinomyces sp. AC-20-1]MCL3788888.1 helix-hairpin-helix domain-containing protein [Actinomyces sp. 187325]MCL3793468.1 helix-hairpin-helix domain-containing protein [Actinomyces sp. 217892]
MRVACAPDPAEPVARPRRTGLAPAVAMALGALLIVLSLVLAARSVLTVPGPGAPTPSSSTATPSPGDAADANALAPVDPLSAPPTTQPGAGGAGTGQVVVHVAGAVTSPGVVVLVEGARVTDAIDAAGGVAPDADTDQLNLARPLTDGEQVRVPRQGEEARQATGGEGPGAPGQGGTGGGGPGTSGTVNLNTADAAELEALPGIGPSLAQRIISYRAEHGAFTSVDELTAVSGIGSARLEALRELVSV